MTRTLKKPFPKIAAGIRYDYFIVAFPFDLDMTASSNIHIGTSGWSYKHWKEIFYPAKMKPTAYIAHYARHFSVSELNGSFYKLPKQETIAKWIAMVPDDFLFCPKMSRFLSHMKKLHDPEEPLQRFFSVFSPFEKHLGPVLVQLPDNVRFNEAVVRPFYEILHSDYAQYRFAMEVRDDSWFTDESIALMRQFKIILVTAQSAIYPYHETITAKDIFFRFHGPESLYSSSYSDETLREYALKFIDWVKQGHIVWAFFNNDVHGHALRNGAKLKELVSELS
ncbi:DUF72 domain-containing protein [Dyadobacter sp. CY326]|uniref:DUF72 domain-containing protein n=1 Tax=Dyadobacter sp. CY326 TaxID=2907300 RepID=UPI001F4602E1|nr:DUF72 domain-containing protein [Dyadobacter sp. CY326]MCE7064854.1 DUF72 domain-containing protein [Dyadobacter sp. CY326]